MKIALLTTETDSSNVTTLTIDIIIKMESRVQSRHSITTAQPWVSSSHTSAYHVKDSYHTVAEKNYNGTQ